MQKTALNIISLPIELSKKIADSKFRLVHVAAQRVRQLSAGAPVEVATLSIKDPTIALEEAMTGRLRVLLGEEARKAREEFEKQREQARIEEELSAKEEEIRKELSVYLSGAKEEGAGEALPEEAEGAEYEEGGEAGEPEEEGEEEPEESGE